MTGYPKFGTAPIRCGKTKCAWRGYETDLKKMRGAIGGMSSTNHVCPACGCDNYSFMTEGEVKAWERKKSKQSSGEA